jgi:hypothetical protein
MSLSIDLYVTTITPPLYEDGDEIIEQANVYDANITHNLAAMAQAAGIYKCLWRAEENGIKVASDLIAPLRFGLDYLCANATECKKHNAPNGWGTYNEFLPWVAHLLTACERYPEATLHFSR